jgi:hypothetical protein
VDRSLLSVLLDQLDRVAYPSAVHEYEAAGQPSDDAIGNILILGLAILPGFVVSVIDGKRPDRRDEIIEALEREDPFKDEPIVEWVSTKASTYPKIWSYLIQLDQLRQMTLDCITAECREMEQSPKVTRH